MILWMMPDNATHTQAVMESFLETFKKENPGIEVNIKVINRRTLWARIFTLKHEIGHEDYPDLVAIPHYWTALLNKANMILNLTELDKTLRVDNCLDPLKPHCYKKDSVDIYSYPWWMDITALHYRNDHLKLVSDDPAKLLSTWGGLLQACGELKKYFEGTEGYMPMQNSDWRGSLSHRSVLPCLWGRGADLFNIKDGSCGFGTKEFEEGMADFINLAAKEYMPILTERSSIGNISAGKSSLIMTRKQGISIFEGRHKDFDVKTLPVPKTGANYINYLSGVNLVIPRGSDNPEHALTLLKWITRPEKQLEYASKTEVFPASESGFEKFLLSSPQRLQNYTNIIAGARTLPNHIATGTIMEVMANVMSAVASSIIMHKYGPETLKEQLKKAKEEVEGILSLYNE